MRIVVCGGQSYGFVPPHTPRFAREEAKRIADMERDRHDLVLNAAVERLGLTEVAAGMAHGSDELTRRWASRNNIPFVGFRSDWQHLGLAAGPQRNEEMLTQFKPDKVIAFPGEADTIDCVERAERKGIEVIKIDWK